MNARILVVGACAMLATNAANATVYFDTVNPPAGPAIGYDGPSSDGTTVLATSFAAPATPNFSSISLTLSADKPSDGGSVLVYLVSNTGGSSGVAGTPSYTATGNTFDSFKNASLIGAIADSTLATTGVGTSLVSLTVAATSVAAVAATTTNNEYWIGLVASSAGSSFDWYYNGNANGTGTAGQAYFNNYGNVLSSSASDAGGPYQLQVSTPEPTTLAVLGASLAGFGYFRRRRTPKV